MSENQGHVMPREVARDVLLQLLLQFGVTALAVRVMWNVQYGNKTFAPGDLAWLMVNTEAQGVGYFASVVGFFLSACWGRQPNNLRIKRLVLVSGIVCCIQVGAGLVQKATTGHGDGVANLPLPLFVAAAVFGTAIRCALGYFLSLVLPERNAKSATGEDNPPD